MTFWRHSKLRLTDYESSSGLVGKQGVGIVTSRSFLYRRQPGSYPLGRIVASLVVASLDRNRLEQ